MSAPKQTPPGGCLTPVRDTGWASKAQYVLRQTNTTIGRAPEAHVRILDRRVSRAHAVISADNDSYHLIQRSTTNPTFVNKMPVANILKLKSGDIIEFAEGVALRFDVFPENDFATEPNVLFSRRISVILAADVVDFTRLVETASEATLRKLEGCHAIFQGEVERHGGQLVQKLADSVLALFSSVLLAVVCARSLQQELREFNRDLAEDQRMQFRIAVNTGDILAKPSGEVQGDAINLAVRIQSLAEPGSVLVSRVVYDQVAELGLLEFRRMGAFKLKNISREVEVYQLVLDV